MRRLLCLTLACTTCLIALPRARAALGPSVSEALDATTLPDLQLETLDGQTMRLPGPAGQPLVVDFFASWCAVCEAEHKELRALYETYAPRGVRFVGILADTIETPDTVAEARDKLKREPLPYPVLLMTAPTRTAFQYVGFPATYLVTADGRFSTTYFGYHPRDELATAIASLGNGTPVNASPTGAALPQRRPWEHNPFAALLPQGWAEWHPMMVHFPIALLVLEALVLAVYARRPRPELERMAFWLLVWAVLSLLPVVYSGLRDVGTKLGADWPLWSGLADRAANFLRLESTVSLHVLLALLTGGVAALRLVWRKKRGTTALTGRQGRAFALVTLLGIWLLFAAGQVGGSISHA